MRLSCVDKGALWHKARHAISLVSIYLCPGQTRHRRGDLEVVGNSDSGRSRAAPPEKALGSPSWVLGWAAPKTWPHSLAGVQLAVARSSADAAADKPDACSHAAAGGSAAAVRTAGGVAVHTAAAGISSAAAA